MSCLRQIRRGGKLGLLIGALLITCSAKAIEFVQRDQFISSEAETLRDEMWISAQTVTISGEAQNDLFASGADTLSLLGRFQGDIWGAGNHVIAGGIFDDQVRLAARTAQISGTLHGSLTAIGTTVQIQRTAILYKNLFCLTENVILEGMIRGRADIVAKKATIGGRIDGDLSVTAQDIIVLPGTILNGNLTYTAPKELVLSPSVMLNGQLTRTSEPPPPQQFLKPGLAGHFTFALAALLTGLVFSSVFPRYSLSSVALLQTSRTPCLLTGFAALFLIPIAAVLILFTFVGLPLSILLILFYLILLYLSKIIVGFRLGALILRRKEMTARNRGTTLAAGLLIIYALTAFTAISLTVNLLVIITGLGALLQALFKKPVLIIQTPVDIKTTTEE